MLCHSNKVFSVTVFNKIIPNRHSYKCGYRKLSLFQLFKHFEVKNFKYIRITVTFPEEVCYTLDTSFL